MTWSAAKSVSDLARFAGRAAGLLAILFVSDLAAESPSPELPRELLRAVRDDQPLGTGADNSSELAAFNRIVLNARRFSPADFAEHIQPGVTGRQMYESERAKYRGQIVRVVGQLTRLRMVPANPELEKAGVRELYEAWILDPFSFDKPVQVIFTEAPTGLQPAEEFQDAVRVSFDGYFFKRVPYQTKSGADFTPLLVGRALRRNDAPPTLTETGAPANCPTDWLEHVEDDAVVQSARENPDEYNAYNYFVQRARDVSPEQLAKGARPELTFGRLYEAGRAKYRGEIVHVEGRLKRLVWIGSNADLESAGIKDLYEAWIFDEAYFSNPTCVVVTELPPGLKPAEDIPGVRASFDGYFFKRYKYKAVDAWRLAPLAIGRTLSLKSSPPATDDSGTFDSYVRYFVPIGLGSALGLVASVVLIGRWFKSGDRRVQDRLADARAREFVDPSQN